jgi:ribosomal 50S subunit-recycling heat shock protein
MGVRIDTLLHWLCLTRSRSLAGRACREGRVLVNGTLARASREVGPGDRIGLRDPLRATLRELELLELPARQASRKDAPDHYRWLTAAPAGEPWDAAGDEDL